VLAAVVEFVSDLSEKQCVQVLAHIMLMPDADLVSRCLCTVWISLLTCELWRAGERCDS
jgi:hypothetical protein